MNLKFLWINQIGEREWLFFKADGVKDFNRAMRDMGDYFHLPLTGGLREERQIVQLSTGEKLFAVSYWGGFDKWRNGLVAYCKATNRLYAIASQDGLNLSDGTRIDLSEIQLVGY